MIIPFAEHQIALLPEKALWVEALGLLCFADLHLEKDSFYAAHATFLPPYGSLETLQNLENLIAVLKPKIVIAAGDNFHDKYATARMAPTLIDRLNHIVASVTQWHWLLGNHDPDIGDAVHGIRSKHLSLAGIWFRHQAGDGSEPEVSGHYHPKIRFRLRRHVMSSPCFVVHQNRLFLPSFGQYTGGLDVNSADFLKVVPRRGRQIFVIHGREVFAQSLI